MMRIHPIGAAMALFLAPSLPGCTSKHTAPNQSPSIMLPSGKDGGPVTDAERGGGVAGAGGLAGSAADANTDAAAGQGGGGAGTPFDGAAGARMDGGPAGATGTGGETGGTGDGADAAPAPSVIVLTEDGGWSWFESPRALFQGRRLIVGSVASGLGDPARRGDVNAIVYDLASSTTTVVELHNQLELDDHDSAVFLARPDGRLLALYAKHGSENHFYYRVSQPNDPLNWAPEQTFVPSAATQLTYSNLFFLPGENNRIYDFYRGLDASFKPSYAYSDDMGETWTSGNVIIAVPSTQLQRPYVRYATNGTDTIHLIYTEAHPRDFDNSLYHIYYRGGMLYRSDGVAIRSIAQGLADPAEGTRVFQGDAQHVAWSVDAVLDSAERPAIVYSIQVGSAGLPVGQGGDDLRYRYARWDGQAWQDHALAYAGTRLYSGEDDYSGLVAIDPANPSVVYFSTNADPVSGAPLVSSADNSRHYEIFRGRTDDGGATWTFTSVTRNSSADNLRPILPPPAADGQRALIWLRGQYRAYTDYQQQVVALLWRD
jgi:hypothetical protein